MNAPPTTCPRCGQPTEQATERPRFEGQKCTHWIFKNGSLVMSPEPEPVPTKCAPCNRGWVADPKSGAIVEVMHL